MPALKRRLEAAGAVVKAVAGLLALMPGIAVLTGLVDIPPTLADLVKALSFFVSIAVLIGILLLSDRIGRLSGPATAIAAVAAVAVGATATVAYWTFANRHIVVVRSAAGEEEGEETRRYVIPIRPSAELGALVAPYRGDYVEALETSIQRGRLQQLIEAESGGSVAVMVALLVLAQTLLVAGVAGGAWKLAIANEHGEGGRIRAAESPQTV